MRISLVNFPYSNFKLSNTAPCLRVGERAGTAHWPAATSGVLGCLVVQGERSGLIWSLEIYRYLFCKHTLPAPGLPTPDPDTCRTRCSAQAHQVGLQFRI